MRDIAIQSLDIFIRDYYLKFPDFLSQDIWFWLDLKSAIFAQAWAYKAATVEAELRIYPGALSFELQHVSNQVNG